jgi:hypothetical protein
MSVIMVKLELLIEDEIEENDLEDGYNLEDYVKDLIEVCGLDDCLVEDNYKILEVDFVKDK